MAAQQSRTVRIHKARVTRQPPKVDRRLLTLAQAAGDSGNLAMLEFVLVAHLAKMTAINDVHAYERHGYASLADCERDRDEIATKISDRKSGAVLLILCEPDTTAKRR